MIAGQTGGTDVAQPPQNAPIQQFKFFATPGHTDGKNRFCSANTAAASPSLHPRHTAGLASAGVDSAAVTDAAGLTFPMVIEKQFEALPVANDKGGSIGIANVASSSAATRDELPDRRWSARSRWSDCQAKPRARFLQTATHQRLLKPMRTRCNAKIGHHLQAQLVPIVRARIHRQPRIDDQPPSVSAYANRQDRMTTEPGQASS